MSEVSIVAVPTVSARRPRERVDGVLLLDKPTGISSNVALQRARRLFNAAKAGHTGTLDPLASGLLPVCFGEATKFAQALLESRKEYLATVQFGVATATGDSQGEVIGTAPVAFTREELVTTLERFLGRSDQVPPRYAALKYQGRNYYEYARAGVEVPRAARSIAIDTLELVEHEPDRAVLRIGCSKGTYVRTLAEDVAKALGTLAHLTGLRRLATGPFRVDDAHGLEGIEALDPDRRRSLLLPIDAPLQDMPRVVLATADALALIQGRLAPVATTLAGRVRAYDVDGRFLGLADATAGAARAVRLVDTSGARDERRRLPVES